MNIKIKSLDHFVLTVANLERTCQFYDRVLGMKAIEFGRDRRKALQFGEQKINLHQVDRTFAPKAFNPTPGSADFCFITDLPLARVISHLQNCEVEIIEGIVKRTGTMGAIDSIYIRDPDGNLIEIASYLE
jgi:catechol 2,3-dioxygenase-like lactoylglutathione lyase family enzyme